MKKFTSTICASILALGILLAADPNSNLNFKSEEVIKVETETHENLVLDIEIVTLVDNDLVFQMAQPTTEIPTIIEETTTIPETTAQVVEPATEQEIETTKKVSKKKKNANYTEKDLRLMSAIVFSEAGNQCMAGKKAVAIVVMNRLRSDKFAYADTVEEVIYARGQFTPVTNGSLNRSLSMYDNGTLPKECIKAAKYALKGNTEISYNGETRDIKDYYFFSGYVANVRWIIEDHMFK